MYVYIGYSLVLFFKKKFQRVVCSSKMESWLNSILRDQSPSQLLASFLTPFVAVIGIKLSEMS